VSGISVQQLEQDFFKLLRPTSLLARFASAQEVADAALYLCSERASATTGAAMRVDGGTVNQIM
jgi:enoyl-[acyl-carrier-protein] reductase (NADH)